MLQDLGIKYFSSKKRIERDNVGSYKEVKFLKLDFFNKLTPNQLDGYNNIRCPPDEL